MKHNSKYRGVVEFFGLTTRCLFADAGAETLPSCMTRICFVGVFFHGIHHHVSKHVCFVSSFPNIFLKKFQKKKHRKTLQDLSLTRHFSFSQHPKLAQIGNHLNLPISTKHPHEIMATNAELQDDHWKNYYFSPVPFLLELILQRKN